MFFNIKENEMETVIIKQEEVDKKEVVIDALNGLINLINRERNNRELIAKIEEIKEKVKKL